MLGHIRDLVTEDNKVVVAQEPYMNTFYSKRTHSIVREHLL